MSKPVDVDDIAEEFKRHGWTWSLKGRGLLVPDADDIQMALDTAAEILYHEDPAENPQIVMGRLIIQKTETTHHVYLYAGDFD